MYQKNGQGKARLFAQTGGLSFLGNLRFFGGPDLGQGTLHVTAAEAARAHVHPAGIPVHHDTDALHIGRPDPMALRLEWLTLLPFIVPFSQISQNLPMEILLPVESTHIKLQHHTTIDLKMQAFFHPQPKKNCPILVRGLCIRQPRRYTVRIR